jgi:hypothetical protein
MKLNFKIVILFLVLQSCQNTITDETTTVITTEQLTTKRQEIINYINSFSCSETSGCSSIGIGAKPCGGPREFLPYPNNINISALQIKVAEYKKMEEAYNLQIGAISDCSVIIAPTKIGCVNGFCTIIN